MACPGEAPPRGPSLRLADVLRVYAPPPDQWRGDEGRVIRDIVSCRSSELGGRLWRCQDCGHETPIYNSCRNRHCPTCQGCEALRWIGKQVADLLPVHYFHLVFTIPPNLHGLFRRAPRVAYGQILAAAAEALIDVCRSNLGATPGITSVLHTWTQLGLYHPHVHCIATGGGLSLDGQRWIASRERFLVPVRKLSPVFRAKLLERLRRSGLAVPPGTPHDWNVYCKAPMAGPEQVIRYLGRYTHRIAISDRRILKLSHDHVTFSYRDRKANKQAKRRIPAREFARRFLLHVLPRRFVRIRHSGLLAGARKTTRLADARRLLGTPHPPEPQPPVDWPEPSETRPAPQPRQCPKCRKTTLFPVTLIPAAPYAPRPP